MARPINTKSVIATNLELLRETDSGRLSNRKIAERAGLRPGTVDNLFRPERSSPNLETIDALAKAFRLDPWMLLFPDLRAVMEHRTDLRKLIRHYASMDTEGQRLVGEVAERTAQYRKKAS